jgi:hypothetical protein
MSLIDGYPGRVNGCGKSHVIFTRRPRVAVSRSISPTHLVLNGVAMRWRTSGKQRETRHAGTWSVSRPRPFQILRPAPPGFVAGLACLGADSSSAPGAIHWLSGRRSPGRNLQLPDSSSLWSGLLADGHRVNFSLPLLPDRHWRESGRSRAPKPPCTERDVRCAFLDLGIIDPGGPASGS